MFNRKKYILTGIITAAVLASLTACGNSKEEMQKEPAAIETEAEQSEGTAETESENTEETVLQDGDKDHDTESAGFPLEKYEFTKSITDKVLESPVTAYGIEYDENEDHKYDDTLDQSRDSLCIRLRVLEPGTDTKEYAESRYSEDLEYVTAFERYGVQKARLENSDGSAVLTVIRSKKFEDDGEEDYEYTGNLVYTDGTSVVDTELTYSIDKEYGDGEKIEATLISLFSSYGIDYTGIQWADA